jgi:hypothetical protein
MSGTTSRIGATMTTKDRTAERVKRTMDAVRERRATGRDIPVVPRVPELDLAITDMGCDPADPEQFLAAAVILLNAHFKPGYTLVKKRPTWTTRLYAMLVLDVEDEMKRNPKLKGVDSACKKLLTRGRKEGKGLWRGMHGTKGGGLRKRHKIAVNSLDVQNYILETRRKELAAIQKFNAEAQKFIAECESRTKGESH